MGDIKAMTVRLNADQAEELEAIAEVEGAPVSEEIRKAIAAHIDAKKQDKEFLKRVHKSIERNRSILERLAE